MFVMNWTFGAPSRVTITFAGYHNPTSPSLLLTNHGWCVDPKFAGPRNKGRILICVRTALDYLMKL